MLAKDESGNVIMAVPKLRSVTGELEPPGWKHWPPHERCEYLLGMSLDRMREYLSWPAADCDAVRLNAQVQIIRVVAGIASKVGTRAADHETAARINEAIARMQATTNSVPAGAPKPDDASH